MIIVSDAGPLIALSKSKQLFILKELFKKVIIPPAVFLELETPTYRSGAEDLYNAVEKEKWIEVSEMVEVPKIRLGTLDRGETEAILLAKTKGLVLLIDERRGCNVAVREKVKITGTGAILVGAKKKGIINRVSPALDDLMESGYRISDVLRRKILSLAGE